MADTMSTAELSHTRDVITSPQGDAYQEKIIHPLIEPDRIPFLMPELAPALAAYPFLGDVLQNLYKHHAATYNHSLRTGVGLAQLGQEIGFSESERALLIASALAHDGGKARTPLEILDLNGPLGEKRPQMEAHLKESVDMIPGEHYVMKTVVAGHHIADGYQQYQHLWQTDDPKVQLFQLLVSADERTDAVMTDERKYRKSASKQEALGMLLEKRFDQRFVEHGLDPHLLGRIVDIQQAVIQRYPSRMTYA